MRRVAFFDFGDISIRVRCPKTKTLLINGHTTEVEEKSNKKKDSSCSSSRLPHRPPHGKLDSLVFWFVFFTSFHSFVCCVGKFVSQILR